MMRLPRLARYYLCLEAQNFGIHSAYASIVAAATGPLFHFTDMPSASSASQAPDYFEIWLSNTG